MKYDKEDDQWADVTARDLDLYLTNRTPAYYLYLEQKSAGCGYSICCGQRLIKLDGITRSDAFLAFLSYGSSYLSGTNELNRAVLIKSQAVDEIDLDAVYQERERQSLNKSAINREAKERAEYERLKRKFG